MTQLNEYICTRWIEEKWRRDEKKKLPMRFFQSSDQFFSFCGFNYALMQYKRSVCMRISNENFHSIYIYFFFFSIKGELAQSFRKKFYYIFLFIIWKFFFRKRFYQIIIIIIVVYSFIDEKLNPTNSDRSEAFLSSELIAGLLLFGMAGNRINTRLLY